MKVDNISVSARSPYSLTVEWDRPSSGEWDGFSVSMYDDDGVYFNDSIEECTRTYNGLSAGTEYTVLVVTQSGGQESAVAENKFYTST